MDYYNNETILTQAREIESLRQQLADANAEIELLKTSLDNQVCEAQDFAYKLENKVKHLAAALAACAEKDTILRGITLYRAFNGDDWPAIEATQALAIKPDASALKAHDEALIEQCADVIQDAAKAAADNNDLRGYELLRALANAICELKGK